MAIQSEYDDSTVPLSETDRDYAPSLYGLPAGTLWPVTVEDAQAGRHRPPSLAQQEQVLEDAFPEL